MFYINLKGKLSQRKLRQRYSSQRERERERDSFHLSFGLKLRLWFPPFHSPFPFRLATVFHVCLDPSRISLSHVRTFPQKATPRATGRSVIGLLKVLVIVTE